MRLNGRGIGWGLSLGLAFLIGCSDDGATEGGGPGGQGSKPSTSAPATPATPTPSTPPIPPIPPSTPPAKPEPVEDTRSLEELVEAGRVTYVGNCTACHGLDPTKDGALGPAISGASAELIETRVMRAEYPEGYTPKRSTKVMIALPHLKDRLPDLAVYLDSIK